MELIKVKYSLFQVSIKITQRLKLITTIYKFSSHNNRITCNRVIRREQHLHVDAKPDQAHTMTIINRIQNHHTHRKITGHKIRRIWKTWVKIICMEFQIKMVLKLVVLTKYQRTIFSNVSLIPEISIFIIAISIL